MAIASPIEKPLARNRGAGVAPCERRDGGLYPPRIVPPGHAPGPVTFLRRLLRDPLMAIPQDAYEQPIGFRNWPTAIAYVTGPDAVKTVLVDRRDAFARKPPAQRHVLGRLLGEGILLAEGASWKWQRQTTAPLFRHSEIMGYLPTMVAAADAQVADWRKSRAEVHNVGAAMTRATYDVIGRTILVGEAENIEEIQERDRARYGRALPWAAIYGLLRVPGWMPRPGRGVMNRRDDAMRAAVDRMITAQIQSSNEDGDGGDLLSRLLRARHPDTGQQMSRAQLIDTVLTFLLAGHHTTATALTWTLYLLATAPDWAERIHAEVRAVAGDRAIGADDIAQLVVTQQVLKESMRLLPPVPTMSRLATEPCEVAGAPIAKGTFVLLPIYVLHRHRSAWSDPDRFDPERFAPDAEAAHHPCQFMPFGRGPRTCSGLTFAMVEATVMLATFVRAMRFDLPEPDYSPVPISRVVLFPRDGMHLRVIPR